MKHKYYEDLNEHVYTKTLDNGLKVVLIPKPDFYKTFVTFTTNYGSDDLSFIPLGKERKVNQPAGIAHFLEHKLFKMPDGTDAFEKLSNMGVIANAFTSDDKTSYLFSGTENIKESLEYLLDFVQEPYFTKRNVEKERGIIIEEINMYLDNPSSTLYRKLSENTYKNNPLRIDIIGTIESVNKITVNDLYTAYNTFYHPSNMNLIAVGNFDVNEMITLIEANQTKKGYKSQKPIERFLPYEPAKVFKKTGQETANVTIPYVGVSVKLPPKDNLKDQFKNWYVTQMLLDYYFSNSGVIYEELLNKELINNSFDVNSSLSSHASSLQLVTYSNKPEEFIDVVSKALINLKRRKITNERFQMLKRSYYGSFIRALSSIEGLNYYYMLAVPFELDIISIPNLINEIELNDLVRVAQEIKSDFITNYTLYPKKSI